MKKIFFLILICSSSFMAFSQVTQQWVQRYLSSSNETPSIVKTDESGNVYVGGGINYDTNEENYAVVKYNSSGFLQWTQFYNGPSNRYDKLNALTVDGAGNVYVTGNSSILIGGGNSVEIITIKYNSFGVVQWIAKFLRPDNLPSGANAIAVDNSGNVYITGHTIVSPLAYDYITIKYNSAGAEQWVRTYNGSADGYDVSKFIALDGAGNVYITGQSHGVFRRLGITRFTASDYVTIKYDPNGNQMWRQIYNGYNNDDIPKGLALDAAANVYVTGDSWNGTNFDIATAKYTSDGSQLFVVRYNGPANGNDGGRGIVVDATGSAIVTGYSDMGGGITDYTTIKYSATGIQQWLSRYNGPANRSDVANAIGIDVFGSVYVTGESSDGYNNDYATVKYGSNGVQQWVIRYNGPAFANDRAVSLAVYMPSGPVASSASIYVTGASDGVGTNVDFATIKYTQQLIIGGFISQKEEEKEKVLQATGIHKLSTYPNPSNGSTRIMYELPYGSHVSIKLYDISGKEIACIINAEKKAGTYIEEFRLGSIIKGNYIFRLVAESPKGRFVESRPMVVVD